MRWEVIEFTKSAPAAGCLFLYIYIYVYTKTIIILARRRRRFCKFNDFPSIRFLTKSISKKARNHSILRNPFTWACLQNNKPPQKNRPFWRRPGAQAQQGSFSLTYIYILRH